MLGMSAGGVGTHVRGLAVGFVGAGHEVVVAGPAEALATFEMAATGASTSVVAIAERPDPRRDVAALTTLRRLSRHADVVHAHGLRAAALACLATPRSAAPVVATLHNAAPTGRLTSRVYAGLERVVVRRAAVVLGVSPDLVTRVQRLGAPHTGLAVVPAPPPPRVTRDAADVRTDLKVRRGDRLLVSVGRLAPQKDYATLLAAVAGLADLPLHVVIAGDGPQRDVLAVMIAERALPVHLLGRRTDVPDLLAAADLVVSSALWEGQPVWLQEAMLVGAPIVATDAGGTADTVDGAAILVAVGDAEALANGIRAVVTDPRQRATLQAQSRAAAGRLPTLDEAVASALSTYRDADTIRRGARR